MLVHIVSYNGNGNKIINSVFDDIENAKQKCLFLEKNNFINNCHMYSIFGSVTLNKVPEWWHEFVISSKINTSFSEWCRSKFKNYQKLSPENISELFDILISSNAISVYYFYIESHKLNSIFN